MLRQLMPAPGTLAEPWPGSMVWAGPGRDLRGLRRTQEGEVIVVVGWSGTGDALIVGAAWAGWFSPGRLRRVHA